MRISFVLCSRYGSSRVPGKAFRKINGVPVIEHLIARMKKSGIDIILAVPESDEKHYHGLGCKVFTGYEHDPLARMYHAAREYGLDAVIRVTHDKVFIEPRLILSAIDEFKKSKSDYLYSTDFTDGTSFEIIGFDALKEAHSLYSNVEFISYAVKSVAKRPVDFSIANIFKSNHRFLIDYDVDLTLLETVFKECGNDCDLLKAIKFLNRSRWAKNINRLPLVTVYTCGYNASKYISRTIASVIEQSCFAQCEYLLIDDFSDDDTFLKMAKDTYKYPNIKLIRNQENIGLASSSNVALKNARGKFIVRIDADDYFINKKSLSLLIEKISFSKNDAVYPSNYFGSFDSVQHGSHSHHVGGAIFRTKAINHVKFTERLRNYEGLDFFERAKSQISIGYLEQPTFFYRQHEGSLTKNNLEKRAEIKRNIEAGILGDRLA